MESSASEGHENLSVQTEPIDLSMANSKNLVTITPKPVDNASDSLGNAKDIVIPSIRPSTSGSTREVTPMWQVVKCSSALKDPTVLKKTVKKVKFAKGTKRGRRKASATVVSGEGASDPPLPNNGNETIVPARYTGMESAPPPVRDLARSVTLSEFNHAGWFHDRY